MKMAKISVDVYPVGAGYREFHLNKVAVWNTQRTLNFWIIEIFPSDVERTFARCRKGDEIGIGNAICIRLPHRQKSTVVIVEKDFRQRMIFALQVQRSVFV